jgi:glycosyltransferase involved in cell wall biosynthesis
MAGPLTGDDKWRNFARADVFCLPTYYEREGMPLVVLEAMQFSLPVVATRWRGIPSMVRDGRTGFLVPVHDSVATADRLEQLVRNPDLRRTLGAAARAEFERNFTLQVFAARIEQALLSI